MSDIKKIEMIGTVKEGIGIMFKNAIPLFVNYLLFLLTCWIPYLNVGTRIAWEVGIIAKLSKGEVIPMTEIFDKKYRKYMGEYFLTNGLVYAGVCVGFLFFIIPGIVIMFSWLFASMITIDKGKNPAESISLSNHATYGNKGRIFGIYFLLFLVAGIVSGILSLIPVAGIILILLLWACVSLWCIGMLASIYRQLTSNI